MFEGILPRRETQVRFLRYGGAGIAAAVVQFTVLAVVQRWFAPNAAFNVAYFGSVVVHYSLNRFWALPSDRKDSWKQFFEYLATAGASYLINFSLFRFLFSVVDLGVFWSGAAAWAPTTLVVFLLLNYRVFRRKHHGVR